MKYVRAIAQRPHPMGSRELVRVREYIEGEISNLGITPELESGYTDTADRSSSERGQVTNVLARLTGAANESAVMLSAHYDTVSRGPGAADDSAGVAVLLETLRALHSGSKVRKDVIFLFTDGEEKGLWGAKTFTRDASWRDRAGVDLNFEARGTAGPVLMFETSAGNEWLISRLQEAVPWANAQSYSYEVYRRMPNSTDMTVFKRAGLPGLNFAFIEKPANYHTSRDDVADLDMRSLQEQGNYALSLARVFAGESKARENKSGDATYFSTRITPLIYYPASWALPIACCLSACLAGIWWLSWKARRSLWLGVFLPLTAIAVLQMAVALAAPSASYLFEWPLAMALIALAILSAPGTVDAYWRLMFICMTPSAAALLLLPLIPTLWIALGRRAARPIVVSDVLLFLACISPQLKILMGRFRVSL